VGNKGITWALIPVKEFDGAKSRLRETLSADECSGLALNMARDVAAAIVDADTIDGVSLLGSGPAIEKLASQLRCDCMEEFYDVDLSCNLGLAARQLAADGVTRLTIIPGDLPTLSAADIDEFIMRADGDLGLCEAGRDGGTNALVLSPPDAISFQFGDQSARRHLEAGVAAELATREIDLPAFKVDIDTTEDLMWLCKQPLTGHTADFLEHAGIRKRMLETEAAIVA
jgi:2-phospho-L-lactate guanylyltransferase